MKLLLLFSFVLGFVHSASAQYIDQSLVSTAGDFYKTDNISISWSIGEIVTETLIGTDVIITQGFHQSLITPTNIDENKPLKELSFIVYPNPADNQINIKLKNYGKSDYVPNQYVLYNTQGSLLLKDDIFSEHVIIDIQHMHEGVYFLHLINVDSNFNETVIIQKITN